MALTLNNYTGFETQGGEEANSVSGSQSYSTSVTRTGGSALLLGAGTNYYALGVADIVSDAGVGHVFGFAYRTDDTTPTADTDILRGGLTISAGFRLVLKTSGDLWLLDDSLSQIGSAITTPFTANTWHFVELYISSYSATTGAGELFIDGSSVLSFSSQDLGGAAVNGVRYSNSASGPNSYFDDAYILTGATAATERLGSGFKVEKYQNANTTATGDAGALGNAATAAATGTWDDVAETPASDTNLITFADSPSGGSADSAAISNSNTILGVKGIWRAVRGTGSGTVHSVVLGDDNDGNSPPATTVSLTTSAADYFVLRETSLPANTDKIRQGVWTAGAQDITLYEQWAMLLHQPSNTTNVPLDAGSYTLTGYATTITTGYQVALDAGSYSLTGYATTVTRDVPVALDAGSYALTGYDLGTTKQSVVSLDAGSFALTGYDTTITTGATTIDVPLDAGSYALTGYATTVTRDVPVALDAGSFALTGYDIVAAAGRAVALDAGSYALTGYDVAAAAGRAVALDAGSFALTGYDTAVTVDRVVALDAGSFALTGYATTVTRGVPVALDAGSYSLTGYDTAISAGRAVALDAGSFALTGYATTITRGTAVALDAGSFALTGNDTAVTVGRAVALDAGSFTLTGYATTIARGTAVALDAGSFALTGYATTITRDLAIALDAGSFTFTGYDATFTRTLPIALDAGAFALTGYNTDVLQKWAILTDPVTTYIGQAVVWELPSSATDEAWSETSAGAADLWTEVNPASNESWT